MTGPAIEASSAVASIPTSRPHGELFARYEGNPILTAADWPQTVNAVFNPAAVQYEGETLLLVRVEDRTGFSHLSVACSADGLTDWVIDPERSFRPDLESDPERFGIEDPRWTESVASAPRQLRSPGMKRLRAFLDRFTLGNRPPTGPLTTQEVSDAEALRQTTLTEEEEQKQREREDLGESH